VGGNGEFGQHGVIVAQEHVRYRLLDEPDQPRTALPLITFSDRIRIAFNDDTIDVIHLPNGHTDGDSIVWFRNANVLHMGDLFFNGSFPYIDIDHGGSVTGYIDNVAKVLEMIPADTRIIPGHGALANVVELAEYHEMLTSTVAQISTRLASGERIEDIEAAGLGAQWAHYGEGSITAATWIKTIQKASDPTQPAAPSRR
jgi:glyoxylase-like metal-dependent hydrolase (beta-lactamase superfamily II)